MTRSPLCAGLALAAVACGGGDPQKPIGTTEWAVPFARPIGSVAVAGASGHVAAYNNQRAVFFAPDGGVSWDQDFPNGGQDASMAIDPDGAAYAAKPISDSQRVVFDKRAPDGSELWSQTFTVTEDGYALVHAVLVESGGTVLLLLNGRGAVDLGAGPVGEPTEVTRGTWGRFDGDGGLLASGVVDFEVRGFQAAVWPDRDGFVVHALRLTREQLVAFDGDGAELWSLDGPSITAPFCLHEQGELTVVVGAELVRLDAEQRQRWRIDPALRELVPLAGGELIGATGDVVGDCLQQVDAAGEVTGPECFAGPVALAGGLPSSHYYFQVEGGDDLDLHDVDFDRGGDYMVARRAPP